MIVQREVVFDGDGGIHGSFWKDVVFDPPLNLNSTDSTEFIINTVVQAICKRAKKDSPLWLGTYRIYIPAEEPRTFIFREKDEPNIVVVDETDASNPKEFLTPAKRDKVEGIDVIEDHDGRARI